MCCFLLFIFGCFPYGYFYLIFNEKKRHFVWMKGIIMINEQVSLSFLETKQAATKQEYW